jgi:predicted O-methyltransferase YrrM
MIKRAVNKFLNKAGYSLVKLPEPIQGREVIDRGKSIIHKISPDLQVLNGPFKGLKYPSLDITEATLVPKIVGSYESQLHPILFRVINTPYTDIIDVGSAEGYYAVGFALQMPNTTIHCFDVNERDLDFCRKMAVHNNVHNLTYNKLCTPETLSNFDFRGRGFIFCDCEGCELELFTPEVINKLTNVDALIELHDICNPVISSEITTRFQYTHNIQIINNLNMNLSQFIGLDELSEEDREFSTFEHRGGINQNIFMEWAFLTAKTNKETYDN